MSSARWSESQLGSPDRPVAGGRRWELAACPARVRTARRAWATCCLLEACAPNCALRCRQQQQPRQIAMPAGRNNCHTEKKKNGGPVQAGPGPRGLARPLLAPSFPTTQFSPCALKHKKLLSPVDLAQQITATNWIVSHFSLSRPETCETLRRSGSRRRTTGFRTKKKATMCISFPGSTLGERVGGGC